MDILFKIDEAKRKLDELIKSDAPFEKILEVSRETDKLIIEYYNKTKMNKST